MTNKPGKMAASGGVKKRYSANPQPLSTYAIDTLLKSLDDPYTSTMKKSSIPAADRVVIKTELEDEWFTEDLKNVKQEPVDWDGSTGVDFGDEIEAYIKQEGDSDLDDTGIIFPGHKIKQEVNSENGSVSDLDFENKRHLRTKIKREVSVETNGDPKYSRIIRNDDHLVKAEDASPDDHVFLAENAPDGDEDQPRLRLSARQIHKKAHKTMKAFKKGSMNGEHSQATMESKMSRSELKAYRKKLCKLRNLVRPNTSAQRARDAPTSKVYKSERLLIQRMASDYLSSTPIDDFRKWASTSMTDAQKGEFNRQLWIMKGSEAGMLEGARKSF